MLKRALARPKIPLRWLLLICIGILGGTYLLRTNRWGIGRKAVEIGGPAVQNWASSEVKRLSKGAYLLRTSTILVDEARRRVAIDTITLTTDSVANAQREVPLPALALRFRNCALEGIDLERLAAGRGLHVTSVGCDSVATMINVPAGQALRAAGTGVSQQSFLNLKEQLDLPRSVPVIILDQIAFPQLSLALGIAAKAGGRGTTIAFDRLAVRFDSMEYQRGKQPASDRVLLSRDVRVVLERVKGSDEASSTLALGFFSASLARGTVILDSLVYQPVPGGFADSLGVSELRVGHLGMSGVDWRRFLTSGDVQVAHLTIDSALIRLPPTKKRLTEARAVGEPPPSLEVVLRAIDRVVHLDSLTAATLTVIRDGVKPRDSTSTSVALVRAKNVGFDNQEVTWSGPYPVGALTLDASGIVHKGSGERLLVAKLQLDVPQSSLTAEGVQSGPEGDDEAFFRRSRYRTDRLALKAERVALTGIDFPGFFRLGSQAVQRAEVNGFWIDLLSDKRKAPSPGPKTPHRIPQEALRTLGATVRIDTILVRGQARYRERGEKAVAAGVLDFKELEATITGFRSEPLGAPVDAPPLRVATKARLMGVGRFRLDLTLPLASQTFQMRYTGGLGGMSAEALNPFFGHALGMRFTGGEIEAINFEATVTKGRAQGTVTPRWSKLKVELPGVAGGAGGVFGGIRRAVAKFAANTFVIRGDNTGPTARNGVIDHKWTPNESLPTYLWVGIREALLPILKK